MSPPPLPALDALSTDELKRLVVQLLGRVSALEGENRRLREENARLKDLAEAAEAGARRHGPGDRASRARRGAPATPDEPQRQAHAPGHGGAHPRRRGA